MSDNDTAPLPGGACHPALIGAPAFYVTGEDQMRFVTLNSAAGVVLTVVGRFLSREGLLIPFVERQTPNTDRTAKTSDWTLGEGWILNVAVFASSGTPLLGQTFAMLRITRGQGGAVQELATVLQGFVTAQQRLAWPGSPITTTLDRTGIIRSVTGTNPGAGVEISETVPTGARWRLLALAATVVTSGSAGSRRPNISFDDGANLLWSGIGPQTLPASTTQPCFWGVGLAFEVAITAVQMQAGLPVGHVLLAGSRIKTVTTGILAGDDWSAPQMLIEEWLEGA